MPDWFINHTPLKDACECQKHRDCCWSACDGWQTDRARYKAELHHATSGMVAPSYKDLAKLRNEVLDALGSENDPLGRGPKHGECGRAWTLSALSYRLQQGPPYCAVALILLPAHIPSPLVPLIHELAYKTPSVPYYPTCAPRIPWLNWPFTGLSDIPMLYDPNRMTIWQKWSSLLARELLGEKVDWNKWGYRDIAPPPYRYRCVSSDDEIPVGSYMEVYGADQTKWYTEKAGQTLPPYYVDPIPSPEPPVYFPPSPYFDNFPIAYVPHPQVMITPPQQDQGFLPPLQIPYVHHSTYLPSPTYIAPAQIHSTQPPPPPSQQHVPLPLVTYHPLPPPHANRPTQALYLPFPAIVDEASRNGWIRDHHQDYRLGLYDWRTDSPLPEYHFSEQYSRLDENSHEGHERNNEMGSEVLFGFEARFGPRPEIVWRTP